MIFFNLETLEEATQGNPEYLVVALEKYWKGLRLPKNIHEKHKPLKTLTAGSAFLTNPADLFNDRSTDILYKAQYIRLAGRRNYLFYKSHGIAYLDLTLFPDISISAIKHNPLLIIQQNRIYFKYER